MLETLKEIMVSFYSPVYTFFEKAYIIELNTDIHVETKIQDPAIPIIACYSPRRARSRACYFFISS